MLKGYEFVTFNEKINVGVKDGAPIIFHALFTQEYMSEFDIGHYKGILIDMDGNILTVIQSCCAPPNGKIDYSFVENEAKKYYLQKKNMPSRNF